MLPSLRRRSPTTRCSAANKEALHKAATLRVTASQSPAKGWHNAAAASGARGSARREPAGPLRLPRARSARGTSLARPRQRGTRRSAGGLPPPPPLPGLSPRRSTAARGRSGRPRLRERCAAARTRRSIPKWLPGPDKARSPRPGQPPRRPLSLRGAV